ncbi:hypothetical protein K456DRAFT_754508 [Colletotrichum gloeosporioides 23]|nr:hypothetical protein K456DRAFT_754508 [Colletotrichum gloeosporioides 23]
MEEFGQKLLALTRLLMEVLTGRSLNFTDSSATACLIDGTMSREQFAMHLGDENEARCLIASHQGFIPGLVRADIIAMVLNGGTVEVLSLYLEHTLPLGSSGSWVVVDNRLLGTIVATQNDGGLSRAFAIPIESTFNSIRVLTGARKVCLPSTVETKIFDIRSSPPALGASGTVATSDSLKLEILYAVRKAELSDSSPTLFRRNALGTGWAGIRREEVLRIAPGFADSIIDASLKVRTYERLTGLKMNTVRSIIKLGHIFPARSNFRIHFRRWVTANKTSHIHGAPAIAARVILEECLCTEAGENILGLICMLKLLLSKTDLTKDEKKRPWLNRHSREQGYAAWVRNLLVAIFKALEFPSTEIPSEPQLQAFALNCLLGFEGVPGMKPDSENSQREANVLGYLGSRLLVELPEIPPEAYLPVEEDTTHDQLLEAEFVSRMLLNLSDLVRGSRENVLICSGNPWVAWAGLLADCLGLSIAVRMQKSKDFYAEFPHPKRPDVCLFTSINMSAAVCEVIIRPSELLSAPTSFVESCNPRLSRRSSELPKRASKGKSRERYG